MKLLYLALVLPVFGFSCGHANKPHIDPGRYVKTIREGDLERSYILRVPKNYDNRTNLPLVVAFHGWTGNAQTFEARTGLGADAEKDGFILAVPDGTPGIGSLKGWNTGFLNLGDEKADDVKFTGDLLDQVERDLYVDPNRVFVVGHSNGAMMAYDLGSRLSSRIASIAVVSGSIGLANARVSSPASPVSAIIFHGIEDDTVPYDDSHQGLVKTVPAPESAKWWAQQDGCKSPFETKLQDGKVIVDDYKGGRAETEVELVTLVKGNHAWPGTSGNPAQVPATQMIWEFFRSHPKR